MKWLACFVFAFAGSGVAFAQTVTLGIDSRGEVYAGMPFVLSVSAQGFEETPEPTVSDFTMDGATVTFLGMSPNVASSVTIINGRRSATRQVTFVYRYRVSVDTPGTYEVPAITVTQGKKSASSRPGRFSAKDIAKSRDMKIRVKLPARPVWVGETIPLAIELFLAKDPQGNPTFSVPLFEAEDWLIVRAQEPNGRRALPFTVGARDLELPYDRDTTSLDGKQYTRFTFHATLTPKKAGILDVAPARVVAALAAGRGRDAFGFPTMRTRLFKAEDQKRKLEMRALPLSGRPRTFSGAVGSAFSMSVRASRTVVAVGDPIELEVTIRGNTDLTVLGLPNLSGEGGLPADGFDVPQEFSPGTVAEDGSQKVFRVTVRLKSTAVTEIPALVFSYYDPDAAAYREVSSEPIALSVKGSAVVGAGEVVTTRKREAPAKSGEEGPSAMSLVGADVSLSDPSTTLAARGHVSSMVPWLAALYVTPLLCFLVLFWRRRTEGTRAARSLVARKHKAVKELLHRAETAPGRDVAGPLAAALRDLAKLCGQKSAAADVLRRLEDESYDPAREATPLSKALLLELSKAAREWTAASVSKAPAAAALLLVSLATNPAQAQQPLDLARADYEAALVAKERGEVQRRFRAAQERLGQLVEDNPRAVELIVDWGTAALGAGDVGTAVLAYRRAQHLAPGHSRSAQNLDWVRARLPEWARASSDDSALGAFFFWHREMTPGTKHLVAALCFFVFAMLLLPWPRAPRWLRRLGIPFVFVWAVFLGSALLSGEPTGDAVVTEAGVTLRSADSVGAAPSLTEAIPSGAELTVLERRPQWLRVRLSNGAQGWLQRASVRFVIPPA